MEITIERWNDRKIDEHSTFGYIWHITYLRKQRTCHVAVDVLNVH